MTAAEATVAMEYALGYELMRQAFRAEMERTSVGALAKQLSVSPRTLKRFMEGGEPGKQLWASGRWFVPTQEAPVVSAEALAINLVADTFPPGERADLRRALVEALQPVLNTAGRAIGGDLKIAA